MQDKNTGCKFCGALENQKICSDILNKDCPKKERMKTEYTVALVCHSWYPSRGKKSASRITDYRNKGLGYKLNFCPECGARINK